MMRVYVLDKIGRAGERATEKRALGVQNRKSVRVGGDPKINSTSRKRVTDLTASGSIRWSHLVEARS